MSITVLTAMSEPPRRFDVFTGTGRRRSFTVAEKAAIVAESYAGEDSVCGVARRHGLSLFPLFTWRRLAQPQQSCEAAEPPLFAPAVVAPKPRRCRRRSEEASIEVEIDGVVVRVDALKTASQILGAEPVVLGNEDSLTGQPRVHRRRPILSGPAEPAS